MNLLTYIDLHKAGIFRGASQTSADKIRQFCDSLAAYPAAAGADLRMAQISDFVYGYGRFLSHEYPRHYSASICDECVRRLRTVLRHAIANREVAAYDPIPAVIARLEATNDEPPCPAVRPSSDTLQATNDEPPCSAVRPSSNLSSELDTLTRALTWAFAKRNASPQRPDRRERDEMTDNRAAMIHLFGVLFGGLDISEVLTLPAAVDGRVYVERYGRSIALPETVAEIVRMHNHGKVGTSDGYLFHALLDGDTPETIAGKADTIYRRSSARLAAMGLTLGQYTPLDACLTLAIESGCATAPAVEAIIAASIAGDFADLPDDIIATLDLGRYLPLKSLRQNWYALCSYSPRLRGRQMRGLISRSGVLGPEKYALSRLYDPLDRTDDDADRSTVSRFLFFRSTPYEAHMVDSVHTDASVLRRRQDKAYHIIPRVEIEFMQEHLRDFRDDVELIDRDTWMRRHQADFTRMSEVVIHEGPFRGYTATIVDIKRPDADHTYYILRLPHDQYTIKATRTALSLRPV